MLFLTPSQQCQSTEGTVHYLHNSKLLVARVETDVRQGNSDMLLHAAVVLVLTLQMQFNKLADEMIAC